MKNTIQRMKNYLMEPMSRDEVRRTNKILGVTVGAAILLAATYHTAKSIPSRETESGHKPAPMVVVYKDGLHYCMRDEDGKPGYDTLTITNPNRSTEQAVYDVTPGIYDAMILESDAEKGLENAISRAEPKFNTL